MGEVKLLTAAAPLQRRLQPSTTDTAFQEEVVATVRLAVRHHVHKLVTGALTPDEWQDEMLATLAAGHAQAGYRGRLRAGDTAPYDRDDERFGALVAQEEQQYLSRFRSDIEGGRFGVEEPDTDAIQRRAGLYVARLWGTANEALALVAGDDEEWVWSLGATDHCADCVRLAENSPYRGKPPTLPRMSGTRCLSACGCSCTSRGGLETFAP